MSYRKKDVAIEYITNEIVQLLYIEVKKLKKKARETCLNQSEMKTLNESIKTLASLQREERHAAKEEDVSHLTDEQIAEQLRKPKLRKYKLNTII